MKVAAIIPAAGIGQRMKSHIPKPYLSLADKPILAHTLDIFEALSEIDEITLVAQPSALAYCQEHIINRYGFRKVLRLVPGGKERQDSVFNALKVLHQQEDVDIILVHDGVRPFVNPEAISRVIRAAKRYGAAILAQPAFDTVKKINKDNLVMGTLNRRELCLVQTPQAFQAKLLWKAFVEAYGHDFYGTDEASLIEALGTSFKIKVIQGSPHNIKVTTPEDLALAEMIFEMRQRRQNASRTGV